MMMWHVAASLWYTMTAGCSLASRSLILQRVLQFGQGLGQLAHLAEGVADGAMGLGEPTVVVGDGRVFTRQPLVDRQRFPEPRQGLGRSTHPHQEPADTVLGAGLV